MDANPSRLIQLIGAFFKWKPMIFAYGILTPLISQSISRLSILLPDGITPLMVGLVVATLWGGFAQWKGRWI